MAARRTGKRSAADLFVGAQLRHAERGVSEVRRYVDFWLIVGSMALATALAFTVGMRQFKQRFWVDPDHEGAVAAALVVSAMCFMAALLAFVNAAPFAGARRIRPVIPPYIEPWLPTVVAILVGILIGTTIFK